MSGFVYAIRCGGHVKIGWSTDPVSRLGKIKVDNPLPCELIGFRPASEDDERLAHAALAPWRRSGEWFDFEADAVREFCNSLPAPTVKEPLPLEQIRRFVFAVKQSAFADIAGVSQATVSRWEAGELSPDLGHLHKIRDAAIDDDLPWDDAFFFDGVPPACKLEVAA
jgi:hypothetical protein